MWYTLLYPIQICACQMHPSPIQHTCTHPTQGSSGCSAQRVTFLSVLRTNTSQHTCTHAASIAGNPVMVAVQSISPCVKAPYPVLCTHTVCGYTRMLPQQHRQHSHLSASRTSAAAAATCALLYAQYPPPHCHDDQQSLLPLQLQQTAPLHPP
jgi:hypothetical protein